METNVLSDLRDEEVEVARRGIEFHQKQIASLDARVAFTLKTVDSLLKQKVNHEGQLRRYESVLSLARRLPPELLGHIFRYCIYHYPLAPLVVSQVCSSWRLAAHSTPLIWTFLIINCARSRVVERTAHWVSMSGRHLPLHIFLYPHDMSLHAVMRILIPLATRWSSMTIDAVSPSYVREVLDIIEAQECRLSLLDTFTLMVTPDGLDGELLDLQGAFTIQRYPRLQTIRLRIESLSMVSLPSTITALSLTIPSNRVPRETEVLAVQLQVIQLFRGLPELTSFVLEFPDDTFPRRDWSSIVDARVVLEKLHTVTLTGHHIRFGVLANLTLPSLRHLGLREVGRFSDTPTIESYFLEMIRRSSPPVESLELHGIDVADNDFTRCLSYLPALKELILHDSEISNEAFHILCSPILNGHDFSWICPQLERLDLRWCSQLCGRVLVELVEARLNSSETRSISNVIIINCSSVREDDVLALAASTVCRLTNCVEDFCYRRGCCANSRYRQRFMLRHVADLRQQRKAGCGLVI